MQRLLMPVLLCCCAFLGGVVTSALGARGFPVVFAQGPGLPKDSLGEASRLSERFEQIVRKVSPAVVSLEAVKPATRTTRGRPVDDSGSGFLMQLPGHKGVFVLTNNHVINQAAANQITITLADGRVLRPQRVWADPETDLAVLSVNSDNLPTATLADSDRVRVGQWVLAFGSPFGLSQTVTHGIISARERGSVSLGSTIRIKDFLQTDAAINPGSSGGPLVNLEGEVIGINTAIASPSGASTGIAFSIPINMARQIALQLIEKGRITRGYLGVQLAPGFEAAEALKLGLGRAQGALVDGVHPDTPAAQAGLRRRDVILELDGVAVRNDNQLINAISLLPPGQRVRLSVWRDRRVITVEAVVGDWNKAEARFRE
jgi:S1-C subfamily serine protease